MFLSFLFINDWITAQPGFKLFKTAFSELDSVIHVPFYLDAYFLNIVISLFYFCKLQYLTTNSTDIYLLIICQFCKYINGQLWAQYKLPHMLALCNGASAAVIWCGFSKVAILWTDQAPNGNQMNQYMLKPPSQHRLHGLWQLRIGDTLKM